MGKREFIYYRRKELILCDHAAELAITKGRQVTRTGEVAEKKVTGNLNTRSFHPSRGGKNKKWGREGGECT